MRLRIIASSQSTSHHATPAPVLADPPVRPTLRQHQGRDPALQQPARVADTQLDGARLVQRYRQLSQPSVPSQDPVHAPWAVLPQQHASTSGGSSNSSNSTNSSSASSSSSAVASTDAAASRAITRRIGACTSWQELECVLDEHCGQLNHIHASACMIAAQRLWQSSVGSQEDLIAGHESSGAVDQACVDRILPRLLLLCSRQLWAEDVGSLAEAGSVDGSTSSSSSSIAGSSSSTSRPSIREFANVLWAASKLPPPPAAWLRALLSASTPHLAAATPQALSNMLYALARLHHAPPEEWVRDVLLVAACQQRAFKPQEQANTLWALGVLGIHPGAAFLDAACFAAPAQAYKPQECVNLLLGLARLGHRPDPGFMDALLAHLQPMLGSGALKPQEQSTLLWALARLQYRPTAAWFAALEKALPGQLQRLRRQEAVVLLWALARLEHSPCEGVWQAMMARSMADMAAWRQQDCANFVGALARLKRSPDAPWRDAFLTHSAALLPECPRQELSEQLWAVARLELAAASGHKAWWRAAMARAERLLPSMSPQQQVNLLWACARAKQAPDEQLLSSLLAASCASLPHYQVRHVSSTLWALAQLQFDPGADWCAACEARLGQIAGEFRLGDAVAARRAAKHLGVRLPAAMTALLGGGAEAW